MKKALSLILSVFITIFFFGMIIAFIPNSKRTTQSGDEPVVVYTITFDSMGGTEIASQAVISGEKGIAPTTVPIKCSTETEEFTFDGWYYGHRLWDFERDPVRKNITLTAKYKVAKYTVDLPIRR